MDFRVLIQRVEPKLRRLATVLNDPAVMPDLRRAAHRSALETIGQLVYDKAYHMSAWDFDIAETLGRIFDKDIAVGLARNLSDSIATGDAVVLRDQPTTYLSSATGAAQGDAFETARSLGKQPILHIRLRGKGDCDWCRARAAGSPYYNAGPQLFARHNKCDCYLRAEGYRSRNGEVRNYRA
jgi:hypothetical protein